MAILLILLCALFVNGATDAPVLLSAPILSGALSKRRASLLSALCNGAGLLFSLKFFPAVSETVRSLAAFGDARGAIFAVLAAAILWAVAAWRFGIPTSESHALLAALAGASVAYGRGADILSGSVLVLLGLFLSLSGGYVLCKIFCKFRMKGSSTLLAAAMSFLHGAQDGQKFVGLWLLCTDTSLVLPAAALILGSACVGGKILDSFGEEGSMTKASALSAEFSSVVCLAFCTLFGLPVSTTHLKSAAMSAAGGKGVTGKTVAAWLLTFPVCFALAFGVTKMLL